jgi:hypothetical protein
LSVASYRENNDYDDDDNNDIDSDSNDNDDNNILPVPNGLGQVSGRGPAAATRRGPTAH